MKTTFKPTRGHNYHVIHETKTGSARKACHVLCGEFFEDGERGARQPTCPMCVKLDNPLLLLPEDRQFFKTVVEMGIWRDAPRSKSFHRLVERDYINPNLKLTRRGEVLADDWKLGPVPMPDMRGVIHAREPLRAESRCNWVVTGATSGVALGNAVMLDGVDAMTLSRYEKLRKIAGDLVVSCLSCLSQ